MTQNIIPMLSYENGPGALDWLCLVFGFKERARWLDHSGRLTHGEIEMNECIIMLATPTPGYKNPRHLREQHSDIAAFYAISYIINGVLVYVDDLDAHYRHSAANGAVILSGIEKGGPGDRYRAEDPEGQRWMFMQKS